MLRLQTKASGGKKGKSKGKGKGKKKKTASKDTKEQKKFDPLHPDVMRNAYYTAHTAEDFLIQRGFAWSGKPKGKKKGGKKKKKK